LSRTPAWTATRQKTTSSTHSPCSTAKSKIIEAKINRKGYINTEDLKEVFGLLGEHVSDDEVNSTYLFALIFLIAMIKIAGVKSNDKINFKEFVDFFYKID
jgi:hypothetical protein